MRWRAIEQTHTQDKSSSTFCCLIWEHVGMCWQIHVLLLFLMIRNTNLPSINPKIIWTCWNSKQIEIFTLSNAFIIVEWQISAKIRFWLWILEGLWLFLKQQEIKQLSLCDNLSEKNIPKMNWTKKNLEIHQTEI